MKSLLTSYITALQAGDTSRLSELLKKDIQFSADGGEQVQVVTTLTIGAEKTIDLLQYVYRAYQRHLRARVISVNHQPAIIYYNYDSILSCQIFEIDQGEIEKIYSVVDPKKLRNLNF